MAQSRPYRLPHPIDLMPRRNSPVPLRPLQTQNLHLGAFYPRGQALSRQGTTTSTAFSDAHDSLRSHPPEKHLALGRAMPLSRPAHAIVATTSITQTRSSSSLRSAPSKRSLSGTSTSSTIVPVSRATTAGSAGHHTTYVRMLLGLDEVSALDNILIAFFNWIILAGFLIFPATYVSLTKASSSARVVEDTPALATTLRAVQHVPLLVMAYACCGLGALGIGALWWRQRRNYVWLCTKIFAVAALNSLASLVSTLISVYGSKAGFWSVQAVITAAVTGGVFLVAAALYLVYNFVLLARVKATHELEMKRLEAFGP